MNTPTTPRPLGRLTALGLAALLALAGCAAQPAAEKEIPQTAAEVVTVADGWAKAADEGMTAAFGSVRNAGDDDVTLVSVESDAAHEVELHETVEDASGTMMMREKDGGFTIPAGGELALEPGANHIMLMGLAAAVKPGDEVALVLTFDDGSTLDVSVPVKDFSGANENYGDDDHADMDH